ncbi:MAG: MarR family transcriptional regulator [Candidatus Tectomicrobia bacterium]|nr:MarR family transcriptional regulator [Candidatus Tectomicrobia bacterium]
MNDKQLHENIVLHIFKTANLLLKVGNRLAREVGISFQQWFILLQLWEKGELGATPTELGSSLFVTKQNMTGMIDRMERDGYVARGSDPNDRRVSRILLTSKGRKALQQIEPLKDQWNKEAFALLTREEKEALFKLLDRYLAFLSSH